MISPVAIHARTPDALRQNDLDALRADSARLDRLIAWLSYSDSIEGLGIRDWNDVEDARAAIDEAVML